jgi:hypothetical protein
LAARLNNLPTTRLNFSGSLRVLVYEGKLTPAELNITREKYVELPEDAAADTATDAPAASETPEIIPEGGVK